MNLLTLSATASRLNTTPFLPGTNAVAVNLSAASVTIQGSDDGVTYTTLATLAASEMKAVDSLPAYVKLSAAGTAYLIGGP